MRHFLEIDDLETQELELVLKLSAATNPPKVLRCFSKNPLAEQEIQWKWLWFS